MFSMSLVRTCTLLRNAGRCQHLTILRKLLTEKMNTPVVYSSLNSILDILNQNKVNNKAIVQLLELYHSVEITSQGVSRTEKRHPLIVVEGLDGSGKSTVTRSLAKRIDAKLFYTPPPIMKDLRPLFDNEPSFRSAYYSLGNYIANMQLLKMLEESPVVLDRFWHSTVAYEMAEKAKNGSEDFKIPPAGSDTYKWPADLVKPDIVFFLSVNEKIRLTRLSRRCELTPQEDEIKRNNIFRENIVMVYENMREPAIEKVDANVTKNKVVNSMYNKMKHLLVTPSA